MLYKKQKFLLIIIAFSELIFLSSRFFFGEGVKSCVIPVTDTTETTKESLQNSSKNEASKATGCSVGTT